MKKLLSFYQKREIMCFTLTKGLPKKCSCKFAHFCPRNRKKETLEEKLEIDLSKQTTFHIEAVDSRQLQLNEQWQIGSIA